MITLGDKKVAKSGTENLYCEKCDYNCSKIYNWNKHILTAKHCNETKGDKKWQKVAKSGKSTTQDLFTCKYCDKEYQYRQTLWRHYKTCKYKSTDTANETINPTEKEMIMLLIKENSELRKEQTDIKELILEIVKNGTHNTTHTNSHNKAFNLNFYLNETCKNAMNITDFVDSIKLQLSDLMSVGEMGFVEGISNIIVKNLNNLDETVRPVHCTDKKRETMYIKDEGQWTKEDDKKTKLKKMINKVADKNIRLLPHFREKYPEYKDAYSTASNIHDKMVVEIMETANDKKEKIIKNISNATIINRL